jgi:hypothetical protein
MLMIFSTEFIHLDIAARSSKHQLKFVQMRIILNTTKTKKMVYNHAITILDESLASKEFCLSLISPKMVLMT